MTQVNMAAETLARVRRNSWLRPLGRTLLGLPGAGRLGRRFLHILLPRGRRVWSQIPAGPARGLWLKVEPYLEERYLTGCPEPGPQEEILRHLRPGGCFYDVGAHIGFNSLLAARLVGKGGRVVAFEPDPSNAAVLHENLSRNDLTEVEVIPAAVWSHLGIVTFQRSAAEHPEMSSRRGRVVVSTDEAAGSSLIEVEAVTLDAFARDHPAPTMIKIDVEGAEAEVLRGAQKLISHARPVWLLEVHHQNAATFLEEDLRQNGYRIEWLARHPEFPFPRHLLARPQEKCYPGQL
jgi:FkbM family methyltransferase